MEQATGAGRIATGAASPSNGSAGSRRRLVDPSSRLVDSEAIGDFVLLGVNRRLDRSQARRMDPMLVELFAEGVMLVVAQRRHGRLGRLEAHVVPAEVLETGSALGKALRTHGRAGRALARQETGRERCERLGFAVGHARAPYWPTTRRPKPPTGRGLA